MDFFVQATRFGGERMTKTSHKFLMGLSAILLALAWIPTAGSDEEHGVTLLNREKCDPGYRLYSSRQTEVAHLIDIDGTEVHQWNYPQGYSWHYAHMLPNGHLVAIVKDYMILELDWHGNLVWKFETRAHHDFDRLLNGNTIVVSRRKEKYEPINPEKELSYDILYEVTPKNKIVWEWKVEEHLDELQKHAELILPCTMFNDWPHINTCEILPHSPTAMKDSRFKKDNLLLCGRHIDTIFIIDRPSDKIVWAWGPGEILGPHMPTMLPNGNILLYDNGKNRSRKKRKYTRVLELDPLAKKIVWEYQSPNNFYSPSRGSNQRLPNGNTLIAESDSGRLLEVTKSGELVWEFLNPDKQPLYRTIRYSRELVDGLVNRYEQ
ncbi:PQQ-binding-like beta-propeller repeat protein [bacterium]|nr:PQQ-binding-like beta-propeller repeat protein [bacterium]